MDARSIWAEVRNARVAPDSFKTIHILEEIYTFHGYPKQMVSDNATMFKSDNFSTYCKNNEIFYTTYVYMKL